MAGKKVEQNDKYDVLVEVKKGFPFSVECDKIDMITEVQKFNPYHDAKGRFSTASGAASFTFKPGASTAHDKAITRARSEHRKKVEALFDRKAGSLDSGYKDTLVKKYDAGTETAKKVYEKYVPKGGAVSDTAYGGVACYDPNSNSISMNCTKDAANPRGTGTTWFHEHGHFIDAAAGQAGTNSKAFRDALTKDVKAYESAYKNAHKIKTIAETREKIGDELKSLGNAAHSVQDIFGGAIGRRYPNAKWGHDASYWKQQGATGVSLEAFAHMFEASFSPEKAKLMETYLPNAWAEFNKILGGLA